MVKFSMALAVTCSALALATAANAQLATINPITPSASSDIGYGDLDHAQPAGAGNFVQPDAGAHFTSTTSITSSEISFESGNVAVATSDIFAQSISRIDLTINNPADGPIQPTIHSQITPAGFGFYLGDNTGGACFNSPAGCGQTHTLDTFQSLASTNPPGSTSFLGSVTVDFRILQDGDVQVADFSGSLGIGLNADGVTMTQDTTGLSSLTGFTGPLTQFGNPNSAWGFAWDATDVIKTLPDLIPAFGSSTLSYIVTVTSESAANCLADNVCLVAYAGMGDPIGRGGDISSAARGVFNFSDPTFNFINGVNFSPFTLSANVDANGDIMLAPSGVPEPATWMMSILGFGLLGAAARRRRVLARA